MSPYLLPPADGWVGELEGAERSALAAGFAALARGGDHAAAVAAADALLASSPDLRPASVLAAQAELAAGDSQSARGRLEGWIAEHPSYRSARLLWARLLELGGDLALAHAEYAALADQLPIASRRARATRDRAVAQAEVQFDRALDAGRLDEARAWVERLAAWEPSDSELVVGARMRLARAVGDEAGELDALRALHVAGHHERGLVERLAALELEIGDADQALRLYDGLAARHPDDASLESLLAAAQLRFRLRLLPENVRRLAARGELGRGDFAALLYWVVPGVRQVQGESARIATDVLDHEWQQEIIRVVNRGLMKLNPVLHRFEPDRPVTRVEALQSAIELAADRPGGDCAKEVRAHPAPRADFLCGVAARCGLLAEVDECLPRASLSGGEALEILGRALSLEAGE